jgi:biotin-dependent carboxylase-like uncharacterized protein
MSRAVLTIEHAGPLTTVQDAGRPGYARFGVTAAGPMDRLAHAAANVAIGNPEGASAIETALGGITVVVSEGSIAIAVAGGAPVVTIDGARVEAWSVQILSRNDRLAIRPGRWGSWTYLAIAGTLPAKRWLGSTATHAQSGFGGRNMAAGDTLVIDDARSRPATPRNLPLPVGARPRQDVRVVLGPQDRFFSSEVQQSFLSGVYTVTDAYDRMGMRLGGPKLAISGSLDMLSEAIVRGSVQVPGHGDPIVLLADHQTTGGYPKIATVIAADQDGLAQLRPRDHLTFRAVSPEQAVAAARIRDRQTRAYLQAVSDKGSRQ